MNIPSVTASNVSATLRHPAQEIQLNDRQPQTITTNSTAQGDTADSSKKSTNTDELNAVIKSVNDFIKPFNNNLQFNIDQDTGQTVVKVMDSATKEVIKQIPSEEMLSLAKALDQLKGLLVTQKA